MPEKRRPRRSSMRSFPITGDAYAARLVRRLRAFLRGPIRDFRADAQLLNVAGTLHAAREAARETDDAEAASHLQAAATEAAARLQRAIRLSGSSVTLAAAVRSHRLDHLETECLLVLALAAIGRSRVTIVGEVQTSIAPRSGDAIRIIRAFRPEGRLVCGGLVCMDEEDAIVDSAVRLHPSVLAALVGRRSRHDGWWDVDTEEALLGKLRPLVKAFVDVAEQLVENDEPRSSQLARAVSRRDSILADLCGKLGQRTDWTLAQFWIDTALEDFSILLVLIGQELGLGKTHFNAFTGRALAAAASDDADHVAVNIRRLAPTAYLRKSGLVRVLGGEGDVGSVDDMGALATCTFELTQRALRQLGVTTSVRKRAGAREPVVRLDQLVLPERVQSAVRMALAQARHADVLFRRWGLAETIGYGRGTTLLFSGPSGTGKTATAEALAHELGRPILAVNASEIESCWVGETEKAIVRAFREAGEAGAVLFWDEADAFFHDRETASKQWEVREVNVLLTELERFEGVCVLATNRKASLDTAVERRVSMRIEFERPDRESALAIWRKLLPAKLPLAPDVNIDVLAAADLSGGQIKNVVLNAARRALARGPRARVTKDDFEQAVRGESEGRWTERAAVGFRA